MNRERHLDFYTDGAYSSKTQMGGWAAICLEDGDLIDEQSGYEPYSTNNRMELTALLCALELADTIETGHTSVTIYVDSAYIYNCFDQLWYQTWLRNGWRTSDKKDVKNQDLWTRIIALYIKNKNRLKLEFVKVKSHTGENQWNDYVDKLAVKRRQELEI
jgi:ribonuclease HI